ncbi:Yip1 family protein [Cognatishimia sp. WU-CL00825]|uniref:YIP1 family protein n=1 Tax=Cognatishimia sp. WU-CL00825 TaxID=3127658 RepID=UPI0031055A0A
MMMFLRHLAVQTVFEPDAAARRVLSLNLTAGQGAMALALASILNGITLYVATALDPEAANLMLLAGVSPVVLSALFFLVIGLSAGFLTFASKAVGGQAEFQSLLSLLAWLQFLRVALQIFGIVASLLSSGLAALMTFLAGLYGLWILVQFIKVANNFDTAGKALAIMGLSVLGLMVSFFFLLTLIGVPTTG